MPRAEMSQEALAELFVRKAVEPPPEANLILARHLQSRESCDLAHAVSEAINRYVAMGSHRLTYYLNPKQVSDQARVYPQYEFINPLGLTITEFHENRVSVDVHSPDAAAGATR